MVQTSQSAGLGAPCSRGLGEWTSGWVSADGKGLELLRGIGAALRACDRVVQDWRSVSLTRHWLPSAQDTMPARAPWVMLSGGTPHHGHQEAWGPSA